MSLHKRTWDGKVYPMSKLTKSCCDGQIFGKKYHTIDCKTKPKYINTCTEYGYIKANNKKGEIIL
jgi:hypothetical protein